MKARGGIDLGGTKIQAVVVDGRNRVRGQARHPTPQKGGPPDVAAAIAESLHEAAGAAGTTSDQLVGVGVGSPGEVDARAGIVEQARNLPGWHDAYPLGPVLAKELGTPIRLGNDVDVAVAGEFKLGAGKPYDSILGVWWGTGVGGGVILDDRQWDGRGTAGEIGHMVVVRDGELCPCGRRGCVEAYAGRVAMERVARAAAAAGRPTELLAIQQRAGRLRITSGVFATALEAGDPLAYELIEGAVKALGAGIASAVNLLDVQAVLIGGGLGDKLGEGFVRQVETAMVPHLFVRPSPLEVVTSSLGDLAGALGAALLLQPT